jgi:hypothetical protein
MAAAGAHLQVTVFADAFHGFTEPDSSSCESQRHRVRRDG